MMNEIKDLDYLLQSSVLKECKILDHKISYLTKPGENYGSLMLLVDVKYQGRDKQEQTVSIVAKKIPENEWLRKMFQVYVTFKKELELYNTIVPTLIKFQRENGITETLDIFPQYYGGRINLNDSDEVDEDGVILLENLKVNGFITGDRKKGFDLKATELLLKALAKFHAVPLALKFLKPECFERKLSPHIKHVPLFEDDEDGTNVKEAIKPIVDIAKQNEETAPLVERITSAMERGGKYYDSPYSTPREPFATITHNDFWVNNAMLKYFNSEPIECKIIDFQVVEMGSPCRDLIFFLFSSVQISVVKEYYDHLIKLYYDTLVKTLSELKCDTQRFTFEEFENEINIEAKYRVFFHVMVMLTPSYKEKEDLKDLKDLSENDMKSKKVSDAMKEKAWFIIREFEKRNWI